LKISRPRSDHLVLEEFSFYSSVFLAILGIILLLLGLDSLSDHNREKFYGGLAGFIFCLFGFIVLFKRIRVEIDVSKGRLSWSQKSIFRGRRVAINLGDIENVILKSVSDSKKDIRYLVFVITNRGKPPFNVYGTNEKQIRVTYSSVKKDEAEKIAGLIRDMTGMNRSPLVEESIREHVMAGRDIEACKLYVETYSVDLTEAKRRINEMRGDVRSSLKRFSQD
jgi:CRISPR/Cas system-associated endoribonuclease Cas2